MKNQTKETLLKTLGIAILGTLLLTVTNGLTFSGITIFDEAILQEFGWTKAALKFRDLINLVTISFIMPFTGIIIDKYGAKKIMLIGLAMMSVLYYMYSFIQTTLHLYAIHFALAFAISGASTLAAVIMVSQRVTKRRGTAIGIVLAGTSVGGIIIPQIGRLLLTSFGWRTAFQYEALIPILVLVLLAIFIKPIEYKKNIRTLTKTDEETGLVELSLPQALKTSVFWSICLVGTACFYSIMGIINHLFLYLRELNFSVESATNAFSIFFAIVLVAKLASGLSTEFINERKLFKIQVALMTFGAIGIAMNTEALVWPSLVIVGLGWGGLYTLLNYMIITTFGVKSVGKIGGTIAVFEGTGSGIGIWLTGFISDKTGSYSTSFWVVVALLTVAFILSFFIKPIVATPSSTLKNK